MNALELILAERKRQDELWGKSGHSTGYWIQIIAEEFGEVARASLHQDDEKIEYELTHLAAVCLAALQDIKGEV